jgi:hypothetical protein
MAFLDNSGDIILDAVLTDVGRQRLARGDGSFRITKFALGDDEINYATFDPSSTAPDTTMASTPVLEAFTNNISSMNSKLQTYTSNEHLYLPVMLLNNSRGDTKLNTTINSYLVSVDKDTTDSAVGRGALADDLAGVIVGDGSQEIENFVRIDQGINNSAIITLDSQMYENQYLVEIDNRLGTIVDKTQVNQLQPSFIDDDQVASYYISRTVNNNFVRNNNTAVDTTTSQGGQVLDGARGSILEFNIRASVNLQASANLFTRLGSTVSAAALGSTVGSGKTYYFIDSVIRVTGLTTGNRLDVPVRFIKLNA